MFITCLFRSPNVDEESDVEVDEEAYDKSLERDEEWLHNLPVTSNKERKIKAKPPTPENLEKIRERRLKELQIFSVLKDILFYFLFLFTLMVVSYGNVDTWSYHYKANIEQILVMGDRINSFTNIKTKEHFWRWAKLTLVPNLEGKFLYNGDIDPSLNGFFADQSSYILGYPVLRQLRVRSNLCEPHSAFVNIINNCNTHYTFLNEDEASYSAGWTPYNETTTYPEYKYIDAEKLDGYPFFGKHAFYSGGGYVAKLKGNQEKIMNRIDRLLSESGWTVIPGHCLLKSPCITHTFRSFLCGLSGGILLFHLVLHGEAAAETSKGEERILEDTRPGIHQASVRGLLERTSGIHAGVVDLHRDFEVPETSQIQPTYRSPLQHHQDLLHGPVLLCHPLLRVLLRLLHRFLPRPEHASVQLLRLHLHLRDLGQYHPGEVSLQGAGGRQPHHRPHSLFLFMGTITFILVNMFLTIINEAFSNVKRDISKQSNDYEVVDFMVYRLKSFFGVSTKSNVVEEKESPKEGKQKTDMTPMDEFPDKVNQLLNSISSVYFDQEKFEDVMKS
ncbi:putative polycystic kidney disease protein 1-like 2-like [Apostichopus japonicus]|uniref:Putative polycystic kidney disease protein 1-like 2-like n=1 Tax=Stichopus japonicus TaxID=307972 RepID=A0A2G8K2S7_STIJA|nr:putative polycystic kidney disease protein 1-like 2-like [Apostichopus japonicus]